MSEQDAKSSPPQSSVDLNNEVVYLLYTYRQTEDEAILTQVFNLLQSITMQEITGLIRRASLPRDLAKDMFQEAYITLWDTSHVFKYSRNPVFITFWRRTLRNRLITLFQNTERFEVLVEDPVNRYEDPGPVDKDPYRNIRISLLDEWKTWKNKKHTALASEILIRRFFWDEEDRPSQKELADKYGLTQTQVSNWEKWVRDTLKERLEKDFPETCKRS